MEKGRPTIFSNEPDSHPNEISGSTAKKAANPEAGEVAPWNKGRTYLDAARAFFGSALESYTYIDNERGISPMRKLGNVVLNLTRIGDGLRGAKREGEGSSNLRKAWGFVKGLTAGIASPIIPNGSSICRLMVERGYFPNMVIGPDGKVIRTGQETNLAGHKNE